MLRSATQHAQCGTKFRDPYGIVFDISTLVGMGQVLGAIET
jgi:hypothetical protein